MYVVPTYVCIFETGSLVHSPTSTFHSSDVAVGLVHFLVRVTYVEYIRVVEGSILEWAKIAAALRQ